MAKRPKSILDKSNFAHEQVRGRKGTRGAKSALRKEQSRRSVAARALDDAVIPAAETPPVFVDNAKARARFVCQRVMIGKTLQEVLEEAPRIDLMEFFETLENDAEEQAYYEKAMRYAGHVLAHESRTLTKELLQSDKPTANQVRAVSIAADNNRFLAQSWNKETYSTRPQPPAPHQVTFHTTLDLNVPGQVVPPRLDAQDIYTLPSLPPPPVGALQDLRDTRVTDVEFSEAGAEVLTSEPSSGPKYARYRQGEYSAIGWHSVGGRRLHGYWSYGPPSQFIDVAEPEDELNFYEKERLKSVQAGFMREGVANAAAHDAAGRPARNGTFGGFDQRD